MSLSVQVNVYPIYPEGYRTTKKKEKNNCLRCARWRGEQASYWAHALTGVSTHKRKQQHLPYRSTHERGHAAKTGKHHETGGFTARQSGAQARPSGKDLRTSGGWGGWSKEKRGSCSPLLVIFSWWGRKRGGCCSMTKSQPGRASGTGTQEAVWKRGGRRSSAEEETQIGRLLCSH